MMYTIRLYNLLDKIFNLAHIKEAKNKVLFISMLTLLCSSTEIKALHYKQEVKLDTLSNFSKKHGGFYYRDKNILAYASRFNLDRKSELVGLNITLSGDTGSCRVRVFGYEGGINAPVIEEDICTPLSLHKSKVGLETMYLEFKQRVPLETKQFYVCIDQIASSVHVITDTVTKQQWCSSRDGEMFYYQMLKTGDNQKSQWLYSKYAFMIEPIIRYESLSDKMFELDTNALVADTALTPAKKVQLPNNHSISCADINNDGFMDVLNDGRLYVNRNGTKLVEVTREIGLQGNPKANIFIDVNNDGFTDILFIGNQDSTLNNSTLFINQSGVAFKVSELQIPLVSSPNSFSVADINQDGYLDVVIGQLSSMNGKEYSPLLVLINTKDGQFVNATSTYIPNDVLLLE
ncbi:MAG: VCBS repeat-containing protein, partial [Candidatus Kapabacteria bacterium]|nr:VCBS repeat-containing protein [Candidatus Kapabacteria bacterium]